MQPPYTVYRGLTNDNFCFCIYAQSLVPAGIGIWYNINRCFASSVIAGIRKVYFKASPFSFAFDAVYI